MSNSETPFRGPRLAINRVYTRRGDGGETRLAGGQRVAKDALRLKAYGNVDELNAFVGLARTSAESVPELAELEQDVDPETVMEALDQETEEADAEEGRRP